MLNSNYVLREYTAKESKAQDINVSINWYYNKNWLIKQIVSLPGILVNIIIKTRFYSLNEILHNNTPMCIRHIKVRLLSTYSSKFRYFIIMKSGKYFYSSLI